MQVIGAMRPPDGSSRSLSGHPNINLTYNKYVFKCKCLSWNDLLGRFIRHFNTLNIDLFADATVTAIFSRIVLWHLDTKGFSKEFDPCIEQVIT